MKKERCQSTIHNLLIDSEESTVGFGMENDSKLQYAVDVYNLNDNDIDKFIFPWQNERLIFFFKKEGKDTVKIEDKRGKKI